jgi:hypothetical protein
LPRRKRESRDVRPKFYDSSSGFGTHVEVLPRRIDLFPELARSKPRHLPCQPGRLFMLTRPQPVDGWGVTRETAMLVLASTPVGTGDVSSDLRACMERHNVATLTRLALERQGALRLPGGKTAGYWVDFHREPGSCPAHRCWLPPKRCQSSLVPTH